MEESCRVYWTYESVEWDPMKTSFALAATVITFLSVGISFGLIFMHFQNYTNPKQQRYIIRILLMVPIYSADTLLSLLMYQYSVFFDVIRDCYEAYVIYSLLQLLISYLGGYEESKNLIGRKQPFSPIMPFCCFRVKPRRWFLRMSMRLTLQYVIIRPLMAFVALILHSFQKYCPGVFSVGHGYLWVSAVNSISVTLAMFSLVQFYVLFKDDMKSHSVGSKFFAVKFVVFLSFWQLVIISALLSLNILKPFGGFNKDELTSLFSNFLLCAEMLLAAVFHAFAFSYKDYATDQEDAVRSPLLDAMRDVANPVDVFGASLSSFTPTRKMKRAEVGANSPKNFEPLEHNWVLNDQVTNIDIHDLDEDPDLPKNRSFGDLQYLLGD